MDSYWFFFKVSLNIQVYVLDTMLIWLIFITEDLLVHYMKFIQKIFDYIVKPFIYQIV